MTAPADVTVELRRPYLVFGAATLVCLGPLALFARLAATNDRGLLIDHVLPLSVGEASVFYGALALCCLTFVAMGTAGLWRLSHRPTYRLTVNAQGVTLPEARVWKANLDATLRWSDLLGVGTSPTQKPTQIMLRSRQGLHVLHQRVLPKDWPLDRVAQLVTERWRES
jgi:hypothetical protein